MLVIIVAILIGVCASGIICIIALLVCFIIFLAIIASVIESIFSSKPNISDGDDTKKKTEEAMKGDMWGLSKDDDGIDYDYSEADYSKAKNIYIKGMNSSSITINSNGKTIKIVSEGRLNEYSPHKKSKTWEDDG